MNSPPLIAMQPLVDKHCSATLHTLQTTSTTTVRMLCSLACSCAQCERTLASCYKVLLQYTLLTGVLSCSLGLPVLHSLLPHEGAKLR
jgi:hypothetical protein